MVASGPASSSHAWLTIIAAPGISCTSLIISNVHGNAVDVAEIRDLETKWRGVCGERAIEQLEHYSLLELREGHRMTQAVPGGPRP